MVKRLWRANRSDKDQQRPLFLAAAALAEGAEVVGVPRRRVIRALLSLVRRRKWSEWGQRASVKDATSALGRLAGDRYAATRLLALVQDSAMEAEVRVGIAEALGRIGQVDEIRGFLLAVARNRAIADWVRVGAAEALERLGRAEEAANAWLALAWDWAVEAGARARAAGALGRLGPSKPEVLAWLRALAEPGTPESVRRAALRRLEGRRRLDA